MATLRDADFRGIKVARGGGMSLGLGTINTGEIVLVGKTPEGEGYTVYNTYPEALLAYDRILLNTGLREATR